MKSKLIHYLLILILLVPNFIFAGTEATWDLKLGQTINWQKVTSYGYYIVHAGTNLYGINPESGAINWQHENIGAFDISSYQEITETPFFMFSSTIGGGIFGFNPADGKVLFSTSDLGITTIKKIYPLKQNNSLMMIVNENNSAVSSMLVLDLVSGKKKWSNSKDFGKLTGYAELNNEEFIMSSFAFIYRVNSNTGEIVFKKSAMGEKGGVNAMQLGLLMEAMGSMMIKDEDININFHLNPLNQDILVLEAETRDKSVDAEGTEKITFSVSYTAFSTKDGSVYWNEPYSLNGKAGSVHFLKDAVIVSPKNSGKAKVNKLNLSSGQGLWGKKGNGVSFKGGIISYQDLPEGILIISSYEKQMAADADLYVNILNPETGELKFDKSIKIKGGLEFTEITKAGLLYKTNLEMNFINMSDGSTVLPKPIRSAMPLGVKDNDISFSMPMGAQDNFIFTYADKEKTLFKIDKENGAVQKVYENIKLEGKEIPTAIDLFDDGIVLSSEQNILKVSYGGKLIYQSYYPAPSTSGFKKVLLLAQAARASYIGATYKLTAAVYTAGSTQTDDKVEQAIYGGLGQAFNEGGSAAMSYAKDAMEQVNARFKSTAQSRDYIFMMTEETKKEYALIQVDKADGSVKQKIVIGRDKDPNYAVDDISNKLFYASDPQTITCYSFD
ncbi:MAG: hypothetical protein QNK51_04465 [Chitinophagales bacterium]